MQLPNKKWTIKQNDSLWPFSKERFKVLSHLEDPAVLAELTNPTHIAEAVKLYKDYAELLEKRIVYLRRLGQELIG
jgi:hypothetical protein